MAASRNEATGDVLANVKGRADAYTDGWDRIFGKKEADELPTACHKCGGEMGRGEAISQTFVGRSDFPGDLHGVTMSPGGSGKKVDCWKCRECGHSVTLG